MEIQANVFISNLIKIFGWQLMWPKKRYVHRKKNLLRISWILNIPYTTDYPASFEFNNRLTFLHIFHPRRKMSRNTISKFKIPFGHLYSIVFFYCSTRHKLPAIFCKFFCSVNSTKQPNQKTTKQHNISFERIYLKKCVALELENCWNCSVQC